MVAANLSRPLTTPRRTGTSSPKEVMPMLPEKDHPWDGEQ